MRIRRDDVDHVRERSRIDEVVGEQVTLKSAGIGSLKGLCPFHDEKSPSFHVRPQVGLWHCFGCGKGGDVISFVQEVDSLTFAEAVERLAGRLGHTLQYEDDGGRGGAHRDEVGRRQRLLEGNRAAAAWYAEQLTGPGDALAARRFLSDRGFDREAADTFGIGFAPRSGEALLKHLRGRGFTEDELVASGLAGRNQRGLYDRFRGRVLWPIRDTAGDVVGFGARRLFDDDRIEAKYLNTPETAVYKKSQVLYGVDLAKREIARRRQVVVVEGYTDVMACHLAGVATAVATCGTAFAGDHVRIVRRLLGDDRSLGSGSALGGEVIFTFDGDAAGQKAALRAFEEDQRFVAQTYVAVAEGGMDPCDLRQKHGDEAVRELVAGRQHLFEFAIRSTVAQFDLDSAVGRVEALRAAAPVVAGIRDAPLRPEFARQLAGWLGMEVEPVLRAVNGAVKAGRTADPGRDQRGRRPGEQPRDGAPARGAGGDGGGSDGHDARRLHDLRALRPDPRDPVARVEREALECLLQVPLLVPADDADSLDENAFEVPAYRGVHHAVRAAGGMATAATLTPQAWSERVLEEAPETLRALVTELTVTPLPAYGDGDEALARYAASVVLRMAENQVLRSIGALRSRVQRMEPDDPAYTAAFAELLAVEARRRGLRERISGG